MLGQRNQVTEIPGDRTGIMYLVSHFFLDCSSEAGKIEEESKDG